MSEDRPLAFLNLCNGEENNLDKWHWVVVVEMFEENGEYFLNIIDDKEVTIDYINVDIKNKVSLEEIIKFICKELTEDRPLAFLNLCNGEENNLDKWHWVVVVEMFEENGEHFLNIIDDKEIIKINLSLWYRTIKNDGGFITFK